MAPPRPVCKLEKSREPARCPWLKRVTTLSGRKSAAVVFPSSIESRIRTSRLESGHTRPDGLHDTSPVRTGNNIVLDGERIFALKQLEIIGTKVEPSSYLGDDEVTEVQGRGMNYRTVRWPHVTISDIVSLTLDQNVFVPQLRDWGALVELQRIEAMLAFNGPLLDGRGCHGAEVDKTGASRNVQVLRNVEGNMQLIRKAACRCGASRDVSRKFLSRGISLFIFKCGACGDAISRSKYRLHF